MLNHSNFWAIRGRVVCLLVAFALALTLLPSLTQKAFASAATISADRLVLDGDHPSAVVSTTCPAGKTVWLGTPTNTAGYGALGASVTCTGAKQVLDPDQRVTEPLGTRDLVVVEYDATKSVYSPISDPITMKWTPYAVTGMRFARTDQTQGAISATLDKPLDGTQTTFLISSQAPNATSLSVRQSCTTGTTCSFTSTTWATDADPGTQWSYQLTSSQGKTAYKPLAAAQPIAGVPGSETAGGVNPESTPTCDCAGDPVNPSTGVYFEAQDDLTMGGRGPALAAARTYSTGRAAQDGPLGYGWSQPYSWAVTKTPDGLTATVRDSLGNLVDFNRVNNAWVGPAHIEETLADAAGGGYTVFTKSDRQTFTFSPTGTLVSVADPDGEKVAMTYDAAGHLTRAAGQDVQSLAFTWTGSRVTSVTDQTSRMVTYGYDSLGNLTSVGLPDGGSWTFTYDSAHRLLTKKDGRNATTTNTYDTSGRAATQSNPLGGLTTFTYGTPASGFQQVTVKDPRGVQTRYKYESGVQVARTERLGSQQELTTTWAYDPQTLRATQSQTGSRITTYGYDQRGNLTTARDEQTRAVTAWTYSPNDLVTSTTDPLGATTTIAYDTHEEPVTVVAPAGSGRTRSTTLTYGNPVHPGDLTAVRDDAGNTAVAAYDNVGSPTLTTDRTGRKTALVADTLGRITKITRNAGVSATGYATTLTYDSMGRLLTSTNPQGSTTATAYDKAGNPVTSTDAEGNASTATYNLSGGPTASTAGNATTATTYDKAGRVTAQTNGKGDATTYGYDTSSGLLVSKVDPLTRSTAVTYDRYAQVTSVTEADANKITYTYDADGRRTKTVTSGSSGRAAVTTQWTWDLLDRAVTMTDAGGTTAYSRDDAGNLTTVDAPGAAADVAYTWDALGRKATTQYPNGSKVTTGYDADGRITSVSDWSNRAHTFTYDTNGDLATTTLPSGAVTTTIARDQAARVTGLTTKAGTTPISSLTYGYDRRNKATSIAGTGVAAWNRPDQTLTYDTAGRTTSDSDGAYTWDAAGNLSQMPRSTARALDAAGQLASATTSGTATTYAYNKVGARTSAGSVAYGYDGLGLLTSNAQSGTTTGYTYDGAGLRRTKKVGSGAVETFAWDTSGSLPLLLEDATNRYVYAGDRMIE